MEKINLRSTNKSVRDEYRRQVKRLMKKGYSYPEISEILGISIITTKRYGRSSQTKEQKRGRKPGEQRRLSPEQEKQIQTWIIDKTPDQYKLPFALWTRKSVLLLIKAKFDTILAERTIGNYLRDWGFTPQKALRKAYEQNEEAVKEWIEKEYPSIKAESKKTNAEILWADETGVRNDDQRSRGYSPRGITPVLSLNAKRFRINMISAVNNQGKVHFMIYQETMKADLLKKFLEKLHKDIGRKIIVILDNLRVHHAIAIKEWLAEKGMNKKIVLHYLPAYSPQLNPDEYLNNDLKGELNRRAPARSQKELEEKTKDSMECIQSNEKRVANYFKHPKIIYAAE